MRIQLRHISQNLPTNGTRDGHNMAAILSSHTWRMYRGTFIYLSCQLSVLKRKHTHTHSVAEVSDEDSCRPPNPRNASHFTIDVNRAKEPWSSLTPWFAERDVTWSQERIGHPVFVFHLLQVIKKQDIDINEMCSTDDESGDGQSTTTQNDVDSEVSFEDDADDEIDTTLIEEEDWIEYIKRSAEDAMEKMERAKISMLEQDSQKNEMEIGTENRNITE